jgi:phosphodiesterase/alkaline phosphatase D-like protein
VAKCGHPNTTYGEQVDCEGTTACDAAPGFDGPSGVGTPKGLYGFRPDAFTAVTQTTATLDARVNPDGQNVTECKFEYGTSTGYGHLAECKSLPGSGTSPVAVSAKIAGLSPNTEYHFRIVTKSSAGTVDGPDIAFRTPPVAAPSVETKGTAGVGASSATLYASVNPRGGALSACTFEYGTGTSYGSSVSCAALPGSGSSPVEVSAAIASGLAANTEYHYRISATNSGGTSKGTDATFKTS